MLEFDAAKRKAGPLTKALTTPRSQRAVKDVVQEQAKAGIDIPDDGEFSKSSWGTYINDRVSASSAIRNA